MKQAALFFFFGVVVFGTMLFLSVQWYPFIILVLGDPYRSFDSFPLVWRSVRYFFSYGSWLGLLVVFYYDWRTKNFVRTAAFFCGMAVMYAILMYSLFSDQSGILGGLD